MSSKFELLDPAEVVLIRMQSEANDKEIWRSLPTEEGKIYQRFIFADAETAQQLEKFSGLPDLASLAIMEYKLTAKGNKYIAHCLKGEKPCYQRRMKLVSIFALSAEKY